MYDCSGVVGYSGQLIKLKQEGSWYKAYQDEFMRFLHNVYGLLEVFLTSCFISGLKDTIKFV